jgi:hypothetical protein
MCESIFIPVLAPVVVPLPPLPLPRLRVRDDAQIQWRIRVNRSQWGLGLSVFAMLLNVPRKKEERVFFVPEKRKVKSKV